jgi:hypothetical protein
VTRGAIQCGCTACVSSTRLNQSLKYSPRADCKSRLPANWPASRPARDDWRYPKLSHRARNHALQVWTFCLWRQIILPIGMMLLYNRKLFPELFWLPKRFRCAKAVKNFFTDFPSSFACTRNRFGKPSPVQSMSILAVYASVKEQRFFDIQPELAELTYSVCRFDIATFTSSRRNAGCPLNSFRSSNILPTLFSETEHRSRFMRDLSVLVLTNMKHLLKDDFVPIAGIVV